MFLINNINNEEEASEKRMKIVEYLDTIIDEEYIEFIIEGYLLRDKEHDLDVVEAEKDVI